MFQVLIIGLGNFGQELVSEFVAKGTDVVVIETDKDKAQHIKDLVSKVIIADATNKDILQEYAKDIDCAIVCLGDKVDSSILITHFLKEMGVKKIIAKATSHDHGEILRVIGAHEVVFPERDMAKRVAASLIAPDILEFIKLSEDFNIVEIAAPDRFIKHTLRSLELRSKWGIDILAIRNPLTGKVQVMPPADYEVRPDDILIVLGEADAIRKIEM
jgi:trk system potassium uptake protein TrkA